MSKVFDIENEEEILKRADLYMHGLIEGFHGLAIDFGFHIDNVWKNTKIFDLSESIRYRLFSSRFHFHLLYKQSVDFRNKHQAIVWSSVPPVIHLEIDKKEHSSLMDSIIFHISSILDYASILVNYILSKSHKNLKWGNIIKSARGGTNIFLNQNTSEVRNSIIKIDADFADALYAYRSELIHNSDDICTYDHSWDLMSEKVSLTFFCTNKVLKHFKRLGDKQNKYSVSYFAQFVIFEMIESLKEIIQVLRKYLALTLKEEDFVVSSKKPLIFFDKNGNRIGAASVFNWKEFERVFKIENG